MWKQAKALFLKTFLEKVSILDGVKLRSFFWKLFKPHPLSGFDRSFINQLALGFAYRSLADL